MSKAIPAQPCAGPNFPLVLANVLSVKDRKPLFKPYVVPDRTQRSPLLTARAADAPDQVGVIASRRRRSSTGTSAG